MTIPRKTIFEGTFSGKVFTVDQQQFDMPALAYKPASDGGYWQTVKKPVWTNEDPAGKGPVNWSGQYRFALEGHDGGNEALACFPEDYGFTLGMEYKGFGINATFQGAAGQYKNMIAEDEDGSRYYWAGGLSENRNLSQEYYDNCFDVAGANAKYPRLSAASVTNNNRNSTLWYRNVSWFKMRDCEVYYKLPASLLRKMKVSEVKLYVQGQNLLSLGQVAGIDAENLNTCYPVMKAVNMGLSIVF